ncbi:hypothetical protein MKW92_016725 [Papaver armeniacum]|nr:hypothetical protein MKW92_016725 [Papaver armeniacum]
MEEKSLDIVLVPLGLLLMVLYHTWLFLTILHQPKRTVVGLNALSRKRWVSSMMSDPNKNGVLAVQTIRNSIMASTLLATTAITMSSIIGVFVSSTTDTKTSALIYGNTSRLAFSIKYFAILVCFLFAFLCNVQSIRYYVHVSFMVSLPATRDESIDYITRSLNRASYFWSIGLRAFYISFPLFLWIFGPIPMFACCCILLSVLYFLDTTSSITRELHSHHMKHDDDLKMKDSVELSQLTLV